jgi:uncharacterized glyoxalase superfamily protein PhnB
LGWIKESPRILVQPVDLGFPDTSYLYARAIRCAPITTSHGGFMSTSTSQSTVKPIPEGMHSLTPHLVCKGAADAMAWYTRAFNAVELGRLAGPDGKLMHGIMRIGDSCFMLNDEFPEHGCMGPRSPGGSAVTMHLYVENADAAFGQAVEAGATVRMPLEDMFWGDRYGTIEDPFGHSWAIATHQQDLTDQQIKDNFANMCG